MIIKSIRKDKKDKTGRKYGMLTIIGFDRCEKVITEHCKRPHYYYYWKCRCECGKEVSKNYCHLIHRKTDTKSCGCVPNIGTQVGNKSPYFKGYGEISATHFNSIRQGAIDRHHEFNLTIEYIWDIFIKQSRKCALSGLDIYFGQMRKLKRPTASLDRIDSSKGYVEGNVQWLHKDVNNMKQKLNQPYFIDICKKITECTKK